LIKFFVFIEERDIEMNLNKQGFETRKLFKTFIGNFFGLVLGGALFIPNLQKNI
jgi:hypothetical protein